jgi:gamma-glutamyltranspeptidase / glutathione hydrolase
MRIKNVRVVVWSLCACLLAQVTVLPQTVKNLSPALWPKGEYERFLAAQDVERSAADAASGRNGAVTVTCNGLAARAGLEALRRGGTAMDASLTAALTQVALTAGAPVSYFGMLSLVYYDAKSGKVYTMNAEWNTVRGETSPATIPGGLNLSSREGVRGTAVSGRTALVGGFMKGVGAAHRRFGRLPFARLFDPAIYVAEHGMPVTARLAGYFSLRAEDLARLPATRDIFLKGDGSPYVQGEIFKQPALARTLRAVASQGPDYMYKGPWAEKLVAAVQADGGKMTLEDLAAYEVSWEEPLVVTLGGYQIQTMPPPNAGGVNLIEAQQLALASGLASGPHWTKSGASLRKALDVTQIFGLGYLSDQLRAQLFPGLDLSVSSRVSPAYAAELWKRMQAGPGPFRWKTPAGHHSDGVVAIDRDGNIAALVQSINSVLWGRTAINIDGVSVGDPASFQQAQIAKVPPGSRLPGPTETGILFRNGRPLLGFTSIGAGLHQRTFQALANMMHFGMTVDEAVNAADFLLPDTDMKTGQLTFRVPEGRYPTAVLDEVGYRYQEMASTDRMFAVSEGLWVGISRDPKTGVLRAASYNRGNSAAVAW